MRQQKLLLFIAGEYKTVNSYLEKQFWQILPSLNIVFPYDPTIVFLGIYPLSWNMST